jgi:extracellular elastinolytic metalloproteinase
VSAPVSNMRQFIALAMVSLVLAAASAGAQDEAVTFDAARARIHKSVPGSPLTGPSGGAAAAVVARFLRDHGASLATVASLREVSAGRSAKTGLTHVRMEQRVAGLRVAGAYVKAALDDQGRLVHLIENIADLPARRPVAAAVDERRALRSVLAVFLPEVREEPAEIGREENAVLFDKGAFFHESPRVERVAILMKSGALKAGFAVETWTERGNRLYEALVGGDARVLGVESRTNTDSYNVFAVNPGVPGLPAQAVVEGPGVGGPGSGNAESPKGWLLPSTRFRTQTDVNISGRNVHAYLDTDHNNRPDPGGTVVTDGKFLAAADPGASPSTAGNKAVAVQNLFYLNNVLHDTLYRHGFDEAAGNFQQDNFGKGGQDRDPVRAEAQDGRGTDNANFATPPDGRKPRMQMYLWTGKGTVQVHVNAPAPATYPGAPALFGPALTAAGITGDVVIVDDATGTTSDACEEITNNVSGKIALIDRGTCTFAVKVKNAQKKGAAAAVVANIENDSIFTMGGADATINISSVLIGKTDSIALKASLPDNANATARLTNPPPLQRDGDLDADIVFHEYGHGLTWRMIGGMSGPMSGAIGEGMSDTLAIILTEDDVVGEYAFDNPLGIRSAPYTDYGGTYGDIAPGHEVHLDGEVYGAIGWRLLQNFQAAGISKDLLLDDIVDGMNFTPSGPAFEDMRDGILQSVANNPDPDIHPSHECLVWDAFAHYGVGVGAQGVIVGPSIQVTESFDVPDPCRH